MVGIEGPERPFGCFAQNTPVPFSSVKKVLANGGRSGYHARVNLDTRGEEV
jgi:hypothetical protein